MAKSKTTLNFLPPRFATCVCWNMFKLISGNGTTTGIVQFLWEHSGRESHFSTHEIQWIIPNLVFMLGERRRIWSSFFHNFYTLVLVLCVRSELECQPKLIFLKGCHHVTSHLKDLSVSAQAVNITNKFYWVFPRFKWFFFFFIIIFFIFEIFLL